MNKIMLKICGTLLILSSLFVIEGCKKSYTCKGYPTNMLIWFPYDTGEKLYYTNKTDTICFEIVSKSVETENYEIDFDDNERADCRRYARINTNKEPQNLIQIFYQSGNYSDINEMNFLFNIHKDKPIGNYTVGHLWLYLKNGEYTLPILDSMNINNFTFKNVVTDTSPGTWLSRVWVAQGYGIIKFKETVGTEWVLIPNE